MQTDREFIIVMVIGMVIAVGLTLVAADTPHTHDPEPVTKESNDFDYVPITVLVPNGSGGLVPNIILVPSK